MKTNTREEITEIIEDLTCYDYLRMDGKSHEFLNDKAIKRLEALIEKQKKEAYLKGKLYATKEDLRDARKMLEKEE